MRGQEDASGIDFLLLPGARILGSFPDTMTGGGDGEINVIDRLDLDGADNKVTQGLGLHSLLVPGLGKRGSRGPRSTGRIRPDPEEFGGGGDAVLPGDKPLRVWGCSWEGPGGTGNIPWGEEGARVQGREEEMGKASEPVLLLGLREPPTELDSGISEETWDLSRAEVRGKAKKALSSLMGRRDLIRGETATLLIPVPNESTELEDTCLGHLILA